MGCLICERIEQIKRGENPYFVCELSTGYVVLGDHQRFQLPEGACRELSEEELRLVASREEK